MSSRIGQSHIIRTIARRAFSSSSSSSLARSSSSSSPFTLRVSAAIHHKSRQQLVGPSTSFAFRSMSSSRSPFSFSSHRTCTCCATCIHPRRHFSSASASPNNSTDSTTTDSSSSNSSANDSSSSGSDSGTSADPNEPRRVTPEELKHIRANRLSFRQMLSREVRYANEFMVKMAGPVRTRKLYNIPKLKPSRADWRTLEKKPKKKRIDDEGNEILDDEEAEAYDGPTALVLQDKQTMWEKRFEDAKEAFKSSVVYRKPRQWVRGAAQSENPIIKPIVTTVSSAHQALTETIEDWRDYYENSQDPRVVRIHAFLERVIGETEQGYTMTTIKERIPDWDAFEFQDDMRNLIAPTVVKAYLLGDMQFLKSVVCDSASAAVFSSYKQRETLNHTWDSRILAINNVELARAGMDKDIPVLVYTFSVQVIDCVRNSSTGEIVSGHESNIKTIFNIWAMRPDFADEEPSCFGWRIAEMQMQQTELLL